MKRPFLRTSPSCSRIGLLASWLSLSVYTNACLSAAVPPVPMTNRLGGEPSIRVGVLVNVARVSIGANRGMTMVVDGGAGAEMSRPVVLRFTGGAVAIDGEIVNIRDRVRFSAARRGEYITVDGIAYRGTVEVLASEAGLNVINVTDIEEYLVSVVGSELWSRRESDFAALQAQAVAARTYALRNAGRYRASGYDVRADVSDQAYAGVRAENSAAARAVRSTRGEVIVFDRELITAFYHSTCGRRTASPEEAFRTVRPRPYLQPVSDERPGQGYYNDLSPHFRWTVTWRGDELRRMLSETLPSVLGIDRASVTEIQDVAVHRTGPSGRVTELRVTTATGVVPVFGPDIRAVLRTPARGPLGSTAFTLSVEYQNGTVSQLVAIGSGLGHGVGLCQWGAVGRARSGQDYRTIVMTYYQGASIERWY